jgi:chemotaxis response regulator CheB
VKKAADPRIRQRGILHLNHGGKSAPVANRDIVVIGASAGGLEALKQLLGAMPSDLDASILIVLHTASHARSVLARVLERPPNYPYRIPVMGSGYTDAESILRRPTFT